MASKMYMYMCLHELQVQLDVAGLPVLLSDTAGLRAAAAAADDVEREGMKRAMVTITKVSTLYTTTSIAQS
jgi:tRNA U34 5-carboxymethylaminomethyl modifying GTPase MnmE/TrmE